MPILTLNPTGVVSQSGFTGATLTNLGTANAVYATSASGVGHTIVVDLTDAPGDYNSNTGITLSVRGRTSATASRAKSLLVELLDGAGVTLHSFTTASLTTTNTTYTDTVPYTGARTSAEVSALRLRVTVQEAGGMADTVSTWVDYLAASLDYTTAVIHVGAAALSATGALAVSANKVSVGAAALSASGTLTASGTLDPAGNIVTDSGFGDPANWSTGSGWSVTGGQAVGTPAVAFAPLFQTAPIVEGVEYTVRFTIVSYTSGSVRPQLSGGTEVQGTGRSGVGTYEELLTAAPGNVRVRLQALSEGFNGAIDDFQVIGPASTIHQGAAALSGVGSVTAVGRRVAFGASTLTGSGALVAASTRKVSGASTLTGSGTLAATATRKTFGASALSATGSIAADGSVVGAALSGAAVLTGSGSVSAAATRKTFGTSILTGSAALTTASTRKTFGASTLTGSTTLAAAPTRKTFGASVLAGSRSVAATATRKTFGASVLTGSSVLSADGQVAGPTLSGAASVGAQGSMTAGGRLVAKAAASLQAVGSLVATAVATRLASASLSSGAVMVVTGRSVKIGRVTLVGESTLRAFVGGVSSRRRASPGEAANWGDVVPRAGGAVAKPNAGSIILPKNSGTLS